ncbi:hypothetical protein CBR_g3570, partial [Chara braunii]
EKSSLKAEQERLQGHLRAIRESLTNKHAKGMVGGDRLRFHLAAVGLSGGVCTCDLHDSSPTDQKKNATHREEGKSLMDGQGVGQPASQENGRRGGVCSLKASLEKLKRTTPTRGCPVVRALQNSLEKGIEPTPGFANSGENTEDPETHLRKSGVCDVRVPGDATINSDVDVAGKKSVMGCAESKVVCESHDGQEIEVQSKAVTKCGSMHGVVRGLHLTDAVHDSHHTVEEDARRDGQISAIRPQGHNTWHKIVEGESRMRRRDMHPLLSRLDYAIRQTVQVQAMDLRMGIGSKEQSDGEVRTSSDCVTAGHAKNTENDGEGTFGAHVTASDNDRHTELTEPGPLSGAVRMGKPVSEPGPMFGSVLGKPGSEPGYGPLQASSLGDPAPSNKRDCLLACSDGSGPDKEGVDPEPSCKVRECISNQEIVKTTGAQEALVGSKLLLVQRDRVPQDLGPLDLRENHSIPMAPDTCSSTAPKKLAEHALSADSAALGEEAADGVAAELSSLRSALELLANRVGGLEQSEKGPRIDDVQMARAESTEQECLIGQMSNMERVRLQESSLDIWSGCSFSFTLKQDVIVSI